MRIVEIRSSEDITIEFLDLHNMKKKTTYSNFKNGGIKNPYDRSLKGVGYLGEGEYMTGQSEYDRRVFGIWIGMIDRCYNESLENGMIKNFIKSERKECTLTKIYYTRTIGFIVLRLAY